MGLKQFFCKLFGCADLYTTEVPPPERPIELVRQTLRDFYGAAGSRLDEGIAVKAIYADDGSPAAGVSITAVVCQGSGRLGDGQERQEATSGENGVVTFDVELGGQAWTLYEVNRSGSTESGLFFSSCTDEMTQQIFLYAKPCQVVSEGLIKVEIAALDFRGEPRLGANLVAAAGQSDIYNEGLESEVTEQGNGRYLAVFETKKAGAWKIQVQDVDSFAVGEATVEVLPGPPAKIEIIGTTDPRTSEPFDRLNLTLQLQDELGNPLPPGSLGVRDEEGNEIPPFLEGNTAIFAVNRVGYQYVPLLLYDNESEIQEEVTVIFAATWLSDPGLIYKGDTFKTSLYVQPRPDTGTNHGKVRIEFDPNLVAYNRFDPATGQFNYQYTAQVINNNVLELDFTSQTTYPANDYPNGMYLGDVYWDCQAEGTTCFSLTGQMSPTTDPWDLCVQQKRERDDCICINIIYPTGNAGALSAGQTAAGQVSTVISNTANVGRCCPVLRVETHSCSLSQATINGLIGSDGTVSTQNEFNRLRGHAGCRRANCMNLYMVPITWNGWDGASTIGPPGDIVINPTKVGTVANIGAHEVGHSLGLGHTSTSGDLMHSPQPHGTTLSASECQTIFQNIGSYAC